MDLAFRCESTEGLRHGDTGSVQGPASGTLNVIVYTSGKMGKKDVSQGEAETERNRETEA